VGKGNTNVYGVGVQPVGEVEKRIVKGYTLREGAETWLRDSGAARRNSRKKKRGREGKVHSYVKETNPEDPRPFNTIKQSCIILMKEGTDFGY